MNDAYDAWVVNKNLFSGCFIREVDNIVFNSTIDRNKLLIPAEVLKEIIDGTNDLFKILKTIGVNIQYLGGETADVGDVVRTVAVNGTMMARWPKAKLITNEKIAPGNVIVGLASFGQSNYESEYNSGIGSNGLTSARHDMFAKIFAEKYPESFDPNIADDVTYIGKYLMTDKVEIDETTINAGKLVLSPTRTYAPIIREILSNHFDAVHGLIHCSGGGQTKCLKYLPGPMKIVKDNLFEVPPVFELIQNASGSDDMEMLQVFNMGCRMEIYTSPENASLMISTAEKYGVEARIIGKVIESDKRELEIQYRESIHLFN
jgi:phosphoribosylformylglycinamidine cyclo-ligase